MKYGFYHIMIDRDDFDFIIEGMEKMQNSRVLGIKKMNTMGFGKKE